MITLEEDQMRQHLAVDEITFAIPAQSFAISCAISAEEALPVVTEFALRIAYVCGTLSPGQLQDFFGFSIKETDAVLQSLLDERLLQWNDEHLELTSYALARFQDSSDNLPRFFKIQDWSAEVVFDLISFSPAGRPTRLKRVRSQVELATRNLEQQSRTLQYAEQSFQKNFRQICSKEKAEIYKISAIDAGERFSIPLPCTFHLDFEGQTNLRRDINDDSFGSRLEIAEAITDALSNHGRGSNERLTDFIQTFDDGLLSRYVSSEAFDLRRYVQDVFLTQIVRSGNDRVIPVLGALYLPRNAALLTASLKAAMPVVHVVTNVPAAAEAESAIEVATAVDEAQLKPPAIAAPHAALWWAPRSSLWARTRGARDLAQKIDGLLAVKEDGTSSSGVHVVLPTERNTNRERAFVYQDQFSRLLTAEVALMDGSLEIFVVPNILVCAMFHFHLAHQAVAIPIGFLSTEPEHIIAAGEVIANRVGPRLDYIKAAKESDDGKLMRDLTGIIRSLAPLSEDASRR
jgi:hypothetical protein